MYGGYGNAWAQAQAALWSAGGGTVPTQGQANQGQRHQSVFNSTTTHQAYQQQQQQQQPYMAYGGGNMVTNPTAGTGMMGYMNMGAAANPFMNMNYGGNVPFSNPAATTPTSTPWAANQQYQFQQAFPGGRPPLPPGPPPPDKPKDVGAAINLKQQQQPPLPPPSTNTQIKQNQPPPPPPVANQPIANSAVLTPTASFNALKPEDAYNIIKSAAALGMLPTNGPLAPLTSLNVSEELFGSKGPSGSGIPGLDDVTDDAKLDDKKSPEPELIDLEKDNPNKKAQDSTKVNKSWSDFKANESKNDNNKKQEVKEGLVSKPKEDLVSKTTDPPKSSESKEEKEIVWELRPEIKSQDLPWKVKDSKENEATSVSNPWNEQQKPGGTPNKGWKAELGQETPDTRSENQGKPVSKNPGSNSRLSSSIENNVSSELENENTNENENKQQGPPVRIPLESSDGKELVYDRKTLKQFDQKFREWENDFEKWKRANERHPDQQMYKQYLGQWNLWREQLIEQRRSIIDTMTKAKLESTETIVSKIKERDMSFSGDDFSNDNFSGVEYYDNASNLRHRNSFGENQKQQQNPFQTATRTAPAPPEFAKRLPPAAPKLSAANENKPFGSVQSHNIPFGDKQPQPLMDFKTDGKNTEHDRPVERIRRDGGVGGIFERKSDVNPFDHSTFGNDRAFDNFQETKTSQPKPKVNDAATREEAALPFEWSLPSQTKQEKNPFDMPQSQNPFVQPSGPNPFDVKPQEEERLPSLDDFIKRTNLNFTTPVSISTQNKPSPSNANNMFSWAPPAASSTTDKNSSSNTVERILRDPHEQKKSQPQPSPQPPSKPIRFEANPVGIMPLLIAAKEDTPPPKSEFDKISHMFSRDRGPAAGDSNDNSNFHVEDDDLVFEDDTEVIDFAAGGGENSMDDMDFPRGEKPNENQEDDDDFLEDSEVIDYSQGIPPDVLATMSGTGSEQYGEGYGYEAGYDQGYPPPDYYGPGPSGRGRGRGFPPPWAGRGQPRGFPPGHPYYARGMPAPRAPFYPPGPDYGQMGGRGRPYGRGMPMGRGVHAPGFDPHAADWYQHDGREDMPSSVPGAEPEVIHLSPSPSPEPYGPKPPNVNVKIAPPNPEFERDTQSRRSRSRSRSRERSTRGRDRSRSRDRDRVSRRGRDNSSSDRRDRDRDHRENNSRRDKSRDRRSSPVRRDRHDDRDRDRDRDRGRDKDRDRHARDRRGRSKSKSPVANRDIPIVRNPLFPSVGNVGMLGTFPASNQPPPRYQTILIEDILNKPGRLKRPPRIVIFMRGLPGSGKSHIVKLIKEREVEMGGKAPRILSLDNYFTTEIEKKVKDPITGVEEKKTMMDYEYDEEREPLYRAQLVRQFKKTLDEGYFSFVIVDCVNEFVRQFEEMANFAKSKRFQVYVAEIEESVEVCFKRNVHKRTKEDIIKISRMWEKTPSQFIKLDIRPLLQDEAIQDVEMEDVSDVEADIEKPRESKDKPSIDLELEDIDDEDSGDNLLASSAASSKWDTMEQSEEKLNKLDGLMKRKRSHNEDANVDSEPSIGNWLKSNMPEDYIIKPQSIPGQKRVRWADIEERREQEIMREVGFVVGHTDWNRMMDPTFGSSALTKTKFI